jgi:hypothetical protein
VALLSLAINAADCTPALAQNLFHDEKALTYRTFDSNSGEELFRSTIYPGVVQGTPVNWTETSFTGGQRMTTECVEGNGEGHPATARMLVLQAANGQVLRSDFDTLNPAFYPFLHRPLPSAPLLSIDCLSGVAVDVDALRRGEEVSLYYWLNDAIYFRVRLKFENTETLTLPAGRFEAARARVKVDMTTVFPNLPGWAASLMGFMFAPPIEIWVTRDPPYRVLKLAGVPQGRHHSSTQELIAVADKPNAPPAAAQLVIESTRAPAESPQQQTNSGTFDLGDTSGRVTTTEGDAGPGSHLVAARAALPNGLAIEGRAIITDLGAPRTTSMEQRTYAANGALVQRKFVRFTPQAFPTERNMYIPGDVYPNSFALAAIFPKVWKPNGGSVRFHILGYDGVVNQLELAPIDVEQKPIKNVTMEAAHSKIKPIINLPVYLKPVAYFLIPNFDLYLDPSDGHRLLDFLGPFGPPGSPNAHFVADPTPPALRSASTR